MTSEEATMALRELEEGIEQAGTEMAWYGFISLDEVRDALLTLEGHHRCQNR